MIKLNINSHEIPINEKLIFIQGNYDINSTNNKLQEIATSPYFQIAYPTIETQPKGTFIFKVMR